MSETLEPRIVDKPFARRWVVTTLALMGRSPVRFGALIALLGLLDSGTEALFAGYSVSRAWGERLGALFLPLLWLLTAAVARGADRPSLSRESLALAFRSESAWRAVRAGALYALAIHLFGSWQTSSPVSAVHHTAATPGYLSTPGDFIQSIAVSVAFFTMGLGPCYFPLLALVPGASSEAYLLSRRASRINGELVIDMLLCLLVITGVGLSSALPALGMVNAAFLVFMGTFNYVVYRDIFERRAENAALPVVSPSLAMVSGSVATPEMRS